MSQGEVVAAIRKLQTDVECFLNDNESVTDEDLNVVQDSLGYLQQLETVLAKQILLGAADSRVIPNLMDGIEVLERNGADLSRTAKPGGGGSQFQRLLDMVSRELNRCLETLRQAPTQGLFGNATNNNSMYVPPAWSAGFGDSSGGITSLGTLQLMPSDSNASSACNSFVPPPPARADSNVAHSSSISEGTPNWTSTLKRRTWDFQMSDLSAELEQVAEFQDGFDSARGSGYSEAQEGSRMPGVVRDADHRSGPMAEEEDDSDYSQAPGDSGGGNRGGSDPFLSR